MARCPETLGFSSMLPNRTSTPLQLCDRHCKATGSEAGPCPWSLLIWSQRRTKGFDQESPSCILISEKQRQFRFLCYVRNGFYATIASIKYVGHELYAK
jgi:hypothetical protein